MKLTFLIVALFCFNVSASVFAQQITIHEKNAPLQKVLKQLEKQSGYTFIYENKLLKLSQPVTIHINGGTLSQVLRKCFDNQPLTYSIIEGTVVIRGLEKNQKRNGLELFEPPVKVRGKVSDTTGTGLSGALIRIESKGLSFTTLANGEFNIEADLGDVITISYMGYTPQVFTVRDDMPFQNIILTEASSALKEVVVSTGYQVLPQERATGSFTVVNNAQINRAVSTGILDRLTGITSGLLQNDGSGNDLGISIRGRSTIFANTQPLIVVDNFPYDGDIDNLNPNDIESVTILKDAAAASIWGARSGNGVVVITTKKGNYNQKSQMSVNSNLTFGEIPDLGYVPNISASGFIAIERMLFSNGYYDTLIGGYNQPALTPVVETLIRKRNNEISGQNADAIISAYQNYDARDDFKKYLYRQSVNQQYAINLIGGSQNQKYYVSAGYDKNLSTLKGNGFNRLTLNANNTYSLLHNKVDLSTGLLYTNTRNVNNGISPSSIKFGTYNTLYPYARLVDDKSEHLGIPKYRQLYIENAGGGQLLDWIYRPLDEFATNDNKTVQNDMQASLALRYKLDSKTAVDVRYLFAKGSSNSENLNKVESYYTRNLINRYTIIGF